jgi:hypothetical protein
MHISYSLHLIDCNLADREYILVPEQGVAQEVVQEPAPEPAIDDLPAPALEGKPRFYAWPFIYTILPHLMIVGLYCALRWPSRWTGWQVEPRSQWLVCTTHRPTCGAQLSASPCGRHGCGWLGRACVRGKRGEWMVGRGRVSAQLGLFPFFCILFSLSLFPDSNLNSDLNSNLVPNYPHIILWN